MPIDFESGLLSANEYLIIRPKNKKTRLAPEAICAFEKSTERANCGAERHKKIERIFLLIRFRAPSTTINDVISKLGLKCRYRHFGKIFFQSRDWAE